MAGQKIRIRLKAYDHEVIDSSARKIVDTVTRTGREGRGPSAAADREERVLRHPLAAQVQGLARALRDAHAQAAHRHHRPHALKTVDSLMRLDLPGRCRHRDQALRDAHRTSWAQMKGLLGEKLGMTQVFDDEQPDRSGHRRPAGPCVVT